MKKKYWTPSTQPCQRTTRLSKRPWKTYTPKVSDPPPYPNNKVLNDVPPDIAVQEKDLSRKTRCELSRLRSGYSRNLNSYLSRINPEVSDVCPRDAVSLPTTHQPSFQLQQEFHTSSNSRSLDKALSCRGFSKYWQRRWSLTTHRRVSVGATTTTTWKFLHTIAIAFCDIPRLAGIDLGI